MKATFKIESFLTMKSRNYFVIVGSIENGIVKKGMIILKSDASYTIYGVEAINKSDRLPWVGLTIKYTDELELKVIQNKFVVGEIIELTEST